MDRYRSVDRYRGRAPYSGPLCGKITVQKRCEKIALWTAIGPWTAIGDGPLTGYFIYLLSGIHCQQTLYAPTIYRIQISAVGPSPHLNTLTSTVIDKRLCIVRQDCVHPIRNPSSVQRALAGPSKHCVQNVVSVSSSF